MCRAFVFFLSWLLFATISITSTLVFATEQTPRALVHLLDYLAQDYGGAVNDSGEVTSPSEYKEQVEFARRTIEINQDLAQTKNTPEIASQLNALQNLIQSKAKAEAVSATAQKIKTLVIRVSGIAIAPSHLPDLAHGAGVFQKNCVSCHGVEGKGDGIAGQGLDPKPANFWNVSRMQKLSPFKAFNAIRIGVPMTGMAAFSNLSDDDVWALAFYVMSLRHQWVRDDQTAAARMMTSDAFHQITLDQLATLDDEELSKLLEKKAAAPLLAILRTQTSHENLGNTLATARRLLNESLAFYKLKNFDSAKNRALMAYLEGIEPVEPKLKAIDFALVTKIESAMFFVRQTIDQKVSDSKLEGAISAAENQIDTADTLLNAAPASPGLTFTVAAAIILREGFEAVLVIIALLGVLRAAGASVAAKWVHGGWIAALFAGAVAWIFSGWLIRISGTQREMMEGITSVVAVLVLLYMGFWLHSKTESGRWRAFIDERVHAALAKKNLLGLGFISFTAVFREAFETVLFLRALWIEGGVSSKTAMVSGVLSALLLIFILSWALLKYSTRLPIKKLFDFSSTLMGCLAVILIGKGLHSFQETGIISITASPVNFRVDLIGLYPTLETLASQAITLFLVVSLWLYGKRPSTAVLR